MNRKPFGVYMLTEGGPWMFCQERTLAEALLTARTLRGGELPLFVKYRVWIAAPPVVGRKAALARYRRRT